MIKEGGAAEDSEMELVEMTTLDGSMTKDERGTSHVKWTMSWHEMR